MNACHYFCAEKPKNTAETKNNFNFKLDKALFFSVYHELSHAKQDGERSREQNRITLHSRVTIVSQINASTIYATIEWSAGIDRVFAIVFRPCRSAAGAEQGKRISTCDMIVIGRTPRPAEWRREGSYIKRGGYGWSCNPQRNTRRALDHPSADTSRHVDTVELSRGDQPVKRQVGRVHARLQG